MWIGELWELAMLHVWTLYRPAECTAMPLVYLVQAPSRLVSARQTPICGRSDQHTHCQHLPKKCHATLSIMPTNRIRRLEVWLVEWHEIKEACRAVLFPRSVSRLPSPVLSFLQHYRQHGRRTNHLGRLSAEEWRRGPQRQCRNQHDPALT